MVVFAKAPAVSVVRSLVLQEPIACHHFQKHGPPCSVQRLRKLFVPLRAVFDRVVREMVLHVPTPAMVGAIVIICMRIREELMMRIASYKINSEEEKERLSQSK